MNFKINQKQIGNLFIILSMCGLVWTYFPVASALLMPSAPVSLEANDYTDGILISKIGAKANLVYDVNPWVESEYTRALELGVAHAKGSARPGETGTSYLFAHSSLPLWRMTRTNTPFLLLGRLSSGDEIIITRSGVKYTYRVTTTKEVWPSEVEYLSKPTPGVDLILQTCTPLGTALKRLLVFAKLDSV